MRRALVLAGGGYVASSWEIGLLTGMADAGLSLRDADLLVGTSAGARVALDLASGRPLDEFYERRATSPAPAREPGPGLDMSRLKDEIARARDAGGDTAAILKRYGALAMSLSTGAGADRRTTVAGQLPSETWPDQRVMITAVSAETGERRAFERRDGVDLVDAVIATTAALGTPPMLIDGQHYIDGGYHSSDNADLAIGHDRVLVLALRSPPGAMRLISIETGVAALRAAGALVEVIHPDEETMAALAAAGGQMNPASGGAAAIAGRLQGQRAASAALQSFWRS